MGASGARGRRRADGPSGRGSLMNRRDGDYDEEIREHIEIETRENIARGMSPAEARRAAQRAFGNRAECGSTCAKAARGTGWRASLQDIRYGARLLTRNPLLSFSIVVTLDSGNRDECRRVHHAQRDPAAARRGRGVLQGLPAFTFRDGSMRHDMTTRTISRSATRRRPSSQLSARPERKLDTGRGRSCAGPRHVSHLQLFRGLQPGEMRRWAPVPTR